MQFNSVFILEVICSLTAASAGGYNFLCLDSFVFTLRETCFNFFSATCELVSRVEPRSSLSRVFDCPLNWVFNPAQPHMWIWSEDWLWVRIHVVISTHLQTTRYAPHTVFKHVRSLRIVEPYIAGYSIWVFNVTAQIFSTQPSNHSGGSSVGQYTRSLSPTSKLVNEVMPSSDLTSVS